MSAPTPAERAQVIAGLRQLADLLEANPALPVEKYTRMRVSAGLFDMDVEETDEPAKRAVVHAAAAILGRLSPTGRGTTTRPGSPTARNEP